MSFPQLPLTLPLRLHRERGFQAFSKFFLMPLFLSGRLRFQPSKRIYAGYNQYTKDPKTFQAIILKKLLATNLTIGILLAIDFLINLAFTLRAWKLKKSGTAEDLKKLCEVFTSRYVLFSKSRNNFIGAPASCAKRGLGGENLK